MMDKLLTVEEAAERLGTSTRFVRRLVSSGGSPSSRWAATCGSLRSTWTPSSPAGRVDACRREGGLMGQAGASSVRVAAAAVVGSLAGPLPRPERREATGPHLHQ